MTKANWIAGAAIVFVVLLLMLTFDPLGFLDEQAEEDAGRGAGETLVGDGPKLGADGQEIRPDADPKMWEGEPVGVLHLDLGEASLEGLVHDRNAPLRFARVRPVLPPPHDRIAVRTKKDGTWKITGLPAGAHELRASAVGYRSRTVTAPVIAETEAGKVQPIELEVAPETKDAITVKVTDMFSRPIPGAKVLATTMPWDLHLSMGPDMVGMRGVSSKTGTTDDNGRVTLGPLAPGNYNVVAQFKGYVPGDADNVIVAAGRTRTILLKLREGLSLRGIVVDEEGQPVEDAVVGGMAIPAYAMAISTRTEADGSFVLDGLRKSGYMLFGWHDKAGEGNGNGQVPGPSTKITLKGTGLVKGTVKWKDGTPVQGGTLRPFGAGPFRYVYSGVEQIGEDGTFSVNIAAGDWLLRAQSADGHLAEDVQISVTSGETEDVTITMERTGIVRGVVMDDSGKHISDAEVFVMRGGMPETPSREQYAKTDADGNFEVPGLPDGKVFLHIRHPEYRDTKQEFETGEIEATKEVSIRMNRGASIRGRVVDPNGNGIEGEQVNLQLTFMEARTTFTDAEGGFEFVAVAPDTYMMTTGPFEGNARGLRKSGVQVGEEGVVTVEFQTPVAAGKLTGVVSMAGAPAGGIEVTVRDARGDVGEQVVQTDETGTYFFENIQFGRVQVTAKTSKGLSSFETTNVAEGDTPTRLDLQIGSAVVMGRALDEEGQPIAGAWCSLERADPEDIATGRGTVDFGNTDENGVYEVKGVEPGTYRMRFNMAGYAQLLTQPVTVKENGTANLGDQRLTRGVQITGVVRNDAGSPVEKATVSLKDMQGRPVFNFSMATSGSDGKYALRGIEPGRYTLRMEASGHGPFEAPVECNEGGATVNGTLTRGGTVHVHVEDDGGHPLSGVRVELIDGTGQVVTKTISLANFDTGRRTTNAAGETSLDDLAGGSYTVRCSKDQYEILGSAPAAFIKPGEATSVRVVLQKTQ